MGVFFKELLRARIYKRSQGRITRQVTFAAVALTIALGLWRLSDELRQYDPIVQAKPAMVICAPTADRIDADGVIHIAGAGEADVAIHQGESLVDVVEAVKAQQDATGVTAEIRKKEDSDGRELVFATNEKGADQTLTVEVPKEAFTIVSEDGATARGCDSVNIGLQFLIPGVLLIAFLWITYRLVNVPAFADFLIAVEAEINKVSWPSRQELFRSSLVVLIFIFALAIILAVYDFGWGWLFRMLEIIPKDDKETAMALKTLVTDTLHIM